jgi:hypothetical protein
MNALTRGVHDMSMAAVKNAFQDALGNSAACISAVMRYEHPDDVTENQILTFNIQTPDGLQIELSYTTTSHDLIAAAVELAQAYVASAVTAGPQTQTVDLGDGQTITAQADAITAVNAVMQANAASRATLTQGKQING